MFTWQFICSLSGISLPFTAQWKTVDSKIYARAFFWSAFENATEFQTLLHFLSLAFTLLVSVSLSTIPPTGEWLNSPPHFSVSYYNPVEIALNSSIWLESIVTYRMNSSKFTPQIVSIALFSSFQITLAIWKNVFFFYGLHSYYPLSRIIPFQKFWVYIWCCVELHIKWCISSDVTFDSPT